MYNTPFPTMLHFWAKRIYTLAYIVNHTLFQWRAKPIKRKKNTILWYCEIKRRQRYAISDILLAVKSRDGKVKKSTADCEMKIWK